MKYSELSGEQLIEFEDKAINMPTDVWPKEGESLDVLCSFGVVRATYEDFQQVLSSFGC